MSDDERCNRDSHNKDMYVSPSHSSFEVLDPHDPTLSRHATHLFKKTNEYLQGEIASGEDNYQLLSEMNRLAITKYADLHQIAANLNETLNDYNEIYVTIIKPLLSEVENMDETMARLEVNSYRLENYTKQLKMCIKEMCDAK